MNNTFIIAELSANHNHNLKTAIDSIKAAASIGVDAVKIQTYTADTITLNCRKEDFMIRGGLWDGYNYYDLYKEAYTPWEWHEELFKVAREEGIIMFSTPFDNTAVDLLESLGNPIYKIASFEIMDTELIRYAASKGKPMIMSTGIATEEEIEDAIAACREVGNNDITLLKCTSEYPARIEDANLSMIPAMRERFGVNVGLSDHSMGSLVPTIAVSLGATMVEKHFILDREIGGPDSGFSMDLKEFALLVQNIRDTEKALGSPYFTLSDKVTNARKSGRSLYVAKDMKAGEIITRENVRSVRPGYGLPPKYLPLLLGKKVNRDLEMGTPMSFDYIAE
ncbi:MAG: pseudaminic acid synthase [Bacteroides sp.]|nr:pseudaminic acid synthase [Bacteroides sp.]